jgi:branched-chain amino acid transport system ATP-binding protein
MGIARTYQITSLILDMTVQENIALALQARDGHSFRFFKPARSVKRLQNGAMEILEKVGLAEKAQMKTSELSHGEHRNMELGVALAAHADLLLLDEPMAGLGPDETGKMIELLTSLKGDHTILLIEHDMDAVFALADRISVLVYGHVIATGTPDEIRNNEKVQHAYLGEE